MKRTNSVFGSCTITAYTAARTNNTPVLLTAESVAAALYTAHNGPPFPAAGTGGRKGWIPVPASCVRVQGISGDVEVCRRSKGGARTRHLLNFSIFSLCFVCLLVDGKKEGVIRSIQNVDSYV